MTTMPGHRNIALEEFDYNGFLVPFLETQIFGFPPGLLPDGHSPECSQSGRTQPHVITNELIDAIWDRLCDTHVPPPTR